MKPDKGRERIQWDMPPPCIKIPSHAASDSVVAIPTRASTSPGGAHWDSRTLALRASAALICAMNMPRQSPASRGYDVLTKSTRTRVTGSEAGRPSGVTSIGERSDLLRNQADQEDDDGRAPQRNADEAEAMEFEEGVKPVRPAEN